MRLFTANLRKLVRRPATWLTFGLLAGLLALIMVAVATTAASGNLPSDGEQGGGDPLLLVTFPGAYDQILSFLLGLGGLFAVLYGAAIAGSEWNWGTLKAAVARGESRVWYVLTAFAAIAVVMAGGLLFAFAVTVGAAALGATIAAVPLDGITDAATLSRLPEQMLRGWVAIVEECALGFAIATLARSQLAGIGAGIAFYFGEAFAGVFLPDIVKYGPFSVADASLGAAPGFGGGGGAPTTVALSQETAFLLVGVWLVGALLVAALATDRAEITG
jgi:ABC-type transport system involved in multi-copper enzyme maturation permease subunit